MSEAWHEAEPTASSSQSVVRAAAAMLDVAIVLYALALLVIAFGGMTLSVIRVNDPAKPLLAMAILIPVRLAIGAGTGLWEWPIRIASRITREVLLALSRVRVSAAVKDVVVVFVVVGGAMVAIGLIANVLFPASRPRQFELPFQRYKLAEIFAAWDSGWYFDIASRGYYFTEAGQSSVAFFPLYPSLMRAVASPFGGTDRAVWLAGIAVSWTTFGLALLALHRLAERISGSREIARRTVLYLAVFPFALFFTRVYSESVFLLTSVLAVSRAYDGRWWPAGAWGALATLTRPNGILIALPLALLAISARPSARDVIRRGLPLLLMPLSLVTFSAYVYTLSGDPLGWLHAQSTWGYSLWHAPWAQLLGLIDQVAKYGLYDYLFTSRMASFRLLHGATALAFLMLTPVIFKRLGVPLGAYVLASLLVPLSGNALEGVGRYAAVLFPAFLTVATFKSQWLHEAIVIGSALFLALFVCLFVTLHPIY